MKKILLTFAVITSIILTSCQKDELATPAKFSPTKVADKSDVGQWD